MGCTPTRHARLPQAIKGVLCSCTAHWLWATSHRCRCTLDRWEFLLGQVISIFGMVMLTTLPTFAQRVVLVPPAPEDAILNDAFNRLQAELNIHAFDVQVVPTLLGADPTEALTRVAQASDALASIALLHREQQTVVQIWLVDRVSGKATMRALQVDLGADAANLLAIRAVDLLRESLREFTPEQKPPADIINVDRRAVPLVVQRLVERPTPKFALRADVVALYQWPRLGLGVGPSLGGAYKLGDSIELGLNVAGPIVGTQFETNEGSTTIRQELVWADARWQLLRTSRLTLSIGLVAGALVLNAQGQPKPPLVGKAATLWSFLGGFGLHSQMPLASRVALEFSVVALGTAPKLGVALYDEQTVIGLPILAATAGLRVAL
jgi:hypothetical protein